MKSISYNFRELHAANRYCNRLMWVCLDALQCCIALGNYLSTNIDSSGPTALSQLRMPQANSMPRTFFHKCLHARVLTDLLFNCIPVLVLYSLPFTL